MNDDMQVSALRLLADEQMTPDEAAERLGISAEAFFALIGPSIESITVRTAVSKDDSYSMTVDGQGHKIAQGHTVQQLNITVVTPGGLTVGSPEKTLDAAATLDSAAQAFAAQLQQIETYAFSSAHSSPSDRLEAVEGMAKALLPAFISAIELKVDHGVVRAAMRTMARPALMVQPYGGDTYKTEALTSYAVYLVVMGVNAYAVMHKRFEVIAEIMSISAASRDGSRIPIPLLRYNASRPLEERNAVNWTRMMHVLLPLTGVKEDHYAFADLLAEAAFIQEARIYNDSGVVADIGGIHHDRRRGSALNDFYEDESPRLDATLAKYIRIARQIKYSQLLTMFATSGFILGSG